MKKKRMALVQSIIALLLCVSMLMGTTFAWFTDGVSSGKNSIVAGNLDVELEYLDAAGNWQTVTEATNVFEENTLWEPGHTEVVYLKVSNLGTLALKYQLGVNIAAEAGSVNVNGEAFVLSDYIEFAAIEGVKEAYADRDAARAAVTDAKILSTGYTREGTMLAGDAPQYVAFVVYMPETVGNEANYRTGEQPPRIDLGVSLFATQFTSESDSFGNDYDYAAGFPEVDLPDGGKTNVEVVDGTTSGTVTISGNAVSAEVPAGVAVNEGTTELTLSVTEMSATGSNITLADSEVLKPVDIHVEGVSADNTQPITVTLKGFAAIGLNEGNLKLYHVENGVTNAMTRADSVADFTAHNQFAYDPATGDVTLYMATFSEVTAVADVINPWKGTVATAFGGGDGTEADPYLIANADQLAYFSQAVSRENATYGSASYKLISNINIGHVNENVTHVYYPVGYWALGEGTNSAGEQWYTYGGSFKGTFDGAGHTIANIYQNTWLMDGDYDAGYWDDAMGVFGYVNGGTVKNLTVDNFSSDGEFTPTGVISAYARNATFQNIAIINCNPRVYNTGNGGIVGIGGNSDDTSDLKLTFTNITVDNSNKISALWGSWDVACGGLMGMFRGNGLVEFNNCHVAAQIDVNNDVCANYQYYAYRYAGMIIGSIRKNLPADANGHVYPDMTGISASGCTVNFGTWNDYYYCELVANSLASYTHDHQMSRLTQVESVDVTNMKVTSLAGVTTAIPTSGRQNYVVVSGDHATSNATCYHFVNGTQHMHDVPDTDNPTVMETVNGQEVLKEDKQHIYLEFDQLFTGYGWGVTSKGLKDFEGVTNMDIQQGNQEASKEKFAVADPLPAITAGSPIPVGTLFTAIDEDSINDEAVQVAVSALNVAEGETGITATFVPSTTGNWEDGTITFDKIEGMALVTIQDYNFCKPTSFVINNGEKTELDKFAYAASLTNVNDYLYRVGNQNAFSVGKLFEATESDLPIDSAGVSVEVVAYTGGETLSGVFTPDTSDWTNAKLDFADDFTGPVTVTISENGAFARELHLEVVNATNVTAYSGLGNKNSVLLNDITMSNGSSYYLSGATLYGNGFTFDVTDGAYSGTGSVTNNYLLSLTNANLDNVQIVGAVYTSYGAQVANDYNRPVVLSVGNNTITNCYISNCAAPVRVRDGNLEIINSTLKGGNFANLDIRNGHVVLDNVTTINQVKGNDTAEDGTIVVGLGVVVYYEQVPESTTVEIKNGITQYNHLSESQAESYIKDSTAKTLTTAMFSSDYSPLQYNDGSDTWVNTGILSMTSTVGDDNISDVDGYVEASPNLTNVTGYVHTKQPDATSIAATVPAYATAGQGPIAPSYSFDHTTNYKAKVDDSNDYCYEENGTVYISMDAGDTFNWDTSILTATKNGQTLSYTVSMNGTDYTGKSIAFNTAGSYQVKYTYTDENNYTIDSNGDVTTTSKTYEKNVHIMVATVKAAWKSAEIKVNNTAMSGIYVMSGDYDYSYKMKFLDCVTIIDYDEVGNASTIDLSNNIASTKFVDKNGNDPGLFNAGGGTVTITYSNGKVLTVNIGAWNGSGPSTKTCSVKTDDGVYLITDGSSNAANTGVTWKITGYTYTGNNGASVSNNTTVTFTWDTNSEGYDSKDSGTCVTPDTLITLADGSQKRMDQVTYEDELLVWNFYNGEYTVMPAAALINHGYGNYRVISLKFSDGTVAKTITEHGFFDATTNKWAFINEENVASFVGHEFEKSNGDGFDTVKLIGYSVKDEYTESYSILSAGYNNVMVEGMLSLTPLPGVDSQKFFDALVIGKSMTYDQQTLISDSKKYGLYTYEDFADYITYEQFEAVNAKYLKIIVGKGGATFEQIIEMITAHVPN